MAQKDYNENLFQAIDIIVDKRLKAVNYDATKQAEIVDDSNKHLGWYQVRIDDTITCKAHPIDSSMKFAAGDKVIVLIPNNDINEQKIILSKYSEETMQGYVYETPMQKMIDITGNLAASGVSASSGLVANNRNDEDLNTFTANNESYCWRHIATLSEDGFPLVGYDYLGLKAEFRTLLSQCVEGQYGLKLALQCTPVGQMTPYNGALDAFAKFKEAIFKYVNLYMIANKNGGLADANLWNRVNSLNEANKQLNNKLLVNIYHAYYNVVKTLTDLANSINLSSGSLYDWLKGPNFITNQWLLAILNCINNDLNDENYYTSAGLNYYWIANVNTGVQLQHISDTNGERVLALSQAFLNCYNWILSICTKYITINNNEISYSDDIQPLDKLEFRYCDLSKFNTFLLKNNKIASTQSASAAISTASIYNSLKNITTVNLYLTPAEMVGMIYDCNMPQPQEAIFPIKDLGTIYQIDVYLYQQPNSFFYYNKDNILAPYPYLQADTVFEVGAIEDELIEKEWANSMISPSTSADGRIAENIFVDSLYICAGYIKGTYNEEQAILYTADSDKYSKTSVSLKSVALRWIHKDDTGHFNIVQLTQNTDATGKQKLNITENYEIRWYQKDYTSIGDNYAGNNWQELTDYKNLLYCEFIPRADSYQKELIMCIILLGQNQVIKSNILTFENETDLAAEKMAETNIKEGLNIVCSDKSSGLYYIYDEQFNTQNIATTEQQNLNLVLNNQAVDTAIDINQLQFINYVDEIEWILPLTNTLIKFYWNGQAIDQTTADNNYDFTFIYNTAKSNPDSVSIKSKNVVQGNDLINKLSYTIGRMFNPNYTNNTVFCTIKLPGFVYTLSTKLAFMFGQQFTNGYPYSLVAQCTSDDNPVLYEGTVINRNLIYNIKCYDLNNGMVEVPGAITCTLNGTNLNVDNGNVSIANTNIDITTFYILYITYSFNNITLTKTIPIPIEKNNDNHYNNYINNTAPYVYYNADGSLSMTSGLKFNCSKQFGNNYGFLLFKNDENCGYTDNKFIGKIQNNIFAPVSQYYDNVEQFGVVYGLIDENNSITSANIVWQCPIIKEQYRYPYASINGWNGMDISIDNSNGNLLAPRLGAGKKNSDNTFSGVILGDWSSTSQIDGISNGMTGIYGFRNGAVTYAFNDDGTAFIGGSGEGRIYFDGTHGTITSDNYKVNSAGMLIDLTYGKIDMINSAGHIILDTTNNNQLFNINTTGNKTLINIGTNGYYLQSSNYEAGVSGTKIDLSNGRFETNNGYFRGSINVNDKFKVTSEGALQAYSGYFYGAVEATSINCTTGGNISGIDTYSGDKVSASHITSTNEITANTIMTQMIEGSQTAATNLTWTFSYEIVHDYLPPNNYWALKLTTRSYSTTPTDFWNNVDTIAFSLHGSNNSELYLPQVFTNDPGPVCYISSNISYSTTTQNPISYWTINQDYRRLESQQCIVTIRRAASTAGTGLNNLIIKANIQPVAGAYCGTSLNKWQDIYATTFHGTLSGGDSARSIKNSIQSLSLQNSIFFDNLQPRQYKFNNINIQHYHKGFIVDEVCAAAASAGLKPEDCSVLFSTDEKDPNDPNASLCYNDFIALNTWQIQLLKKRVQTLEDKIKQLEAKLNEN